MPQGRNIYTYGRPDISVGTCGEFRGSAPNPACISRFSSTNPSETGSAHRFAGKIRRCPHSRTVRRYGFSRSRYVTRKKHSSDYNYTSKSALLRICRTGKTIVQSSRNPRNRLRAREISDGDNHIPQKIPTGTNVILYERLLSGNSYSFTLFYPVTMDRVEIAETNIGIRFLCFGVKSLVHLRRNEVVAVTIGDVLSGSAIQPRIPRTGNAFVALMRDDSHMRLAVRIIRKHLF